MLRQGMRTSSIFTSQHVATPRNMEAKRTQHVAPNNVGICCVGMLRSFGRSLTFVDVAWCCSPLVRLVQPCCARACAVVRFSTHNMPRHVATWWSNARNMLCPTMLRCMVSKGCDRLAGAFKYWANNAAICWVELLRSLGQGFKNNCTRVYSEYKKVEKKK